MERVRYQYRKWVRALTLKGNRGSWRRESFYVMYGLEMFFVSLSLSVLCPVLSSELVPAFCWSQVPVFLYEVHRNSFDTGYKRKVEGKEEEEHRFWEASLIKYGTKRGYHIAFHLHCFPAFLQPRKCLLMFLLIGECTRGALECPSLGVGTYYTGHTTSIMCGGNSRSQFE